MCLILLGWTGFLSAAQLAFPKAEGFARYASGGRGGSVCQVTSLEDSGPGSLRDALSKGDRIVVFRVGGVIKMGARIVVKKNVTIAGQTAPGGGITLYGNGLAFNTESGNAIVRYIRVRMGVIGDDKKDAIAVSAGHGYLFDHVSVSWGRDGTLDINDNGAGSIDNVTMQDCIIAQGLHSHSTGGLMQSGKFSIFRTLFIDNHTRNPKAKGVHEYTNNVVYNWRIAGYILGQTQGISKVNIIGNYFIKGPSTSSGPFNRGTKAFHAYISDNFYDDNRDGKLNGAEAPKPLYGPITFESKPFEHPGARKVLSAQEAYHHIVKNAGASLARDAVDKFLMDELTSLGTKGKIISKEDENGIPGNVGEVANGTPPPDSDKDGMPDEWEKKYGLDPNNPADATADFNQDGYTNVEKYINSLVDPDYLKRDVGVTKRPGHFVHQNKKWVPKGILFPGIITIRTIRGSVVKQIEWQGGEISTQGLKPGLYQVSLTPFNGNNAGYRFIMLRL